ncbi:MAG: LLM class flavin-dependent oxidoreductase, partial [Nitrospinota bacterium]
LALYRRALEEFGKPFPEELPIRREVFVARTREEAIRICRPYLETKYRAYHSWGQDKAMPEGDNDFAVPFEQLMEDRFFIGSPEEVAGQLIRMADSIGVNHIIVSLQWPGMPESLTLETIDMMGREVFPLVRQGVK